jgi:exopolysaccharide biosynthesis protein
MIVKGSQIEVQNGRQPYSLGGVEVQVRHFVVRVTGPDNPFRPHQHEQPELWYITAGEAVVSLNAGQFAGGAVWGWVVHEGVEYRPPGRGPLAAAVIIEADGSVRLADDAEVARRRVDGEPDHPVGVVEAFQSYPLLLEGDGRVPSVLLEGSPDIDLGHRDARLALGALADGRLVVALTRFDALGPAFGGVPFGLTIPEISAVMGALGCRWAVALDGGVSAQLALRDSAGTFQAWHGLRRVPLALIATPQN